MKTKIKNAELTEKKEATFDVKLPMKDTGNNVEIQIKIKTEYTSSVLAQDKLQEVAERKLNSYIEGLSKLTEMFCEDLPKINNTVEKIKSEQKNSRIPYDWDYEFNKLIVILRENKNLEKPEKYLEELKKKNVDCVDQDTVKWGLAMIEKAKLGMLNQKQLDYLNKIDLIR